jgi:outer membrane protein OmpA-like peptidoglycan-associated protein
MKHEDTGRTTYLAARIRSGVRWRPPRYLELWVAFVMTLIAVPGAFAGGAREGELPELAMPPQPRQYISPVNEDGVADELRLPFSEVVVPPEDRVIVSYTLQVFDARGALVWSQEDRETTRVGFFGNLFGRRPPSVPIPETLSWDGTYRDSALGPDGAPAADGDYTYQLVITDDTGAAARTPPFNVTVDNTPPELFAGPEADPSVFSPNGDGVRDVLRIRQTGSREVAWETRILAADGALVWQETHASPVPADPRYDVPPPEELLWDGRGSDGRALPEGLYRYEVASTDRAGNSFVLEAGFPIRLSLSAGDVVLRASGDPPAFSPNGDASKDRLPIDVEILEPEGIESWLFEVARAEDGLTLVSREGDGAPPAQMDFDGLTAGGRALPEGEYQALLSVTYDNGTVVLSPPLSFLVDVTPPGVSLSVDTEPRGTDPQEAVVFGGDEKSGVRFDLVVEEGVEWLVRIDGPPEAPEALSLAEMGVGPGVSSLLWRGQGPDAGELPDGVYRIHLEGVDAAGNLGTSGRVTIRKDTRPTPIDLEIEGAVVTPNDDGVDDTVAIVPIVEVTDSIEEFHLEIRNERGQIVRSTYLREPFSLFEWPAENNIGQTVAEGSYTVDFQVIYENGNRPRISGAGPILVDLATAREPTTPPNIRMTLFPVPFSPDDDGIDDELSIRLEASSLRPLAGWELTIADPTGRPFVEYGGEGAPEPLILWDGRSPDGELVQSAQEYQATFAAWDTDGNRSEETKGVGVDILVIREGDRLRINIPSITFAPFTADLFAVELDELEQNLSTLRRLADILMRFPDYQILIEGHAAHLYTAEGPAKRREQTEVLIPLSSDRAEEVRQALIILGIDRDRMRAEGIGGARPVVPHEDQNNRWKNRRVEFILERGDPGGS